MMQSYLLKMYAKYYDIDMTSQVPHIVRHVAPTLAGRSGPLILQKKHEEEAATHFFTLMLFQLLNQMTSRIVGQLELVTTLRSYTASTKIM